MRRQRAKGLLVLARRAELNNQSGWPAKNYIGECTVLGDDNLSCTEGPNLLWEREVSKAHAEDPQRYPRRLRAEEIGCR